MQSKLLTQQLPTFLARLRKTDKPTITSDSVSVQVTEEPPTPAALDTTVEDVSYEPTSSPRVISADSSNTQATSSTLVKKYEIGSGANKVNVRIYKEPPAIKL